MIDIIMTNGVIGFIGFLCGALIAALFVADYYANYYQSIISTLENVNAELKSQLGERWSQC